MITVHVHGLRLFARHGVNPDERAHGQEFVFDIDLDVGERGASDSFVEAVDYSEVARSVRGVSETRQFALIEALADAIADELERRFTPEHLRVRVWKPQVRPAGLDARVGVTVERP